MIALGDLPVLGCRGWLDLFRHPPPSTSPGGENAHSGEHESHAEQAAKVAKPITTTPT
jgi:hypothetical protein